MHMMMRARGLLIACLILSCVSCARQPIVRTETVKVATPVMVAVPAALTDPVPEPNLHGNTNGALADAYLAALHALRQANAKLKAIAGLQP